MQLTHKYTLNTKGRGLLHCSVISHGNVFSYAFSLLVIKSRFQLSLECIVYYASIIL